MAKQSWARFLEVAASSALVVFLAVLLWMAVIPVLPISAAFKVLHLFVSMWSSSRAVWSPKPKWLAKWRRRVSHEDCKEHQQWLQKNRCRGVV